MPRVCLILQFSLPLACYLATAGLSRVVVHYLSLQIKQVNN